MNKSKISLSTSIMLDSLVEKVKFDSKGLVPVIAQSVKTNKVLMLAYMNKDSLKQTIQTKLACYWSRSRNSLWQKGGVSGNVQKVEEIWLDCDGDAILIKVTQEGPACHTGNETCFYTKMDVPEDDPSDEEPQLC